MMENYDDLIEFETEHSGLDFKSMQYLREKFEDLIKDIMSMANADTKEERNIIIGIKLKGSTEREILGINKDDFIDSATYQQVIKENIEPDIQIDYVSYLFKDKWLGIFNIVECNDQPYMMKKDYNNLKKGDCWIRKGSFQSKMTRQDLDKIVSKKINTNNFIDKIQISFAGFDCAQEIELTTIGEIEFPSEKAKKEIQEIIGKRKANPNVNSFNFYYPSVPFEVIPYEKKSTAELIKDLEKLKETYDEEDKYYFYELKSHKVNINILNLAEKYIENASIQVQIDKLKGFLISTNVYSKPEKRSLSNLLQISRPQGILFYPRIEMKESTYCVFADIGDIRHQIPINAFKQPIRILIANYLVGQEIQLNCRLFGKNLTEPIDKILKIKVIPNEILPVES